MAERRQKIRGTTLELDQVIGAQGLLAVDYEKNRLRIYDGVTMGGFEFLNKADLAALYTLPDRLKTDGVYIEGPNRSANEAILNGYYSVTSNVTDLPIASNGTIHVSTSRIGQITQAYSPDGATVQYYRVRTSALVWGPWRRVFSWFDLNDATTAPTIYNADRLGGQLPAYYTAINARLGYTAANKAGDVFGGAIGVNGRMDASGAVTSGQNITAAGHVQAGGGSGPIFGTDGNLYNGIWGAGSTLSNWLTLYKVHKNGDSMYGNLILENSSLELKRNGWRYLVFNGGDGNYGFLNNAGGWMLRGDSAGNLLANGNVYAGSAFFQGDGNISGSVWANWGPSNAYSAIDARIELRAGQYRDDAVAKILPHLAAQVPGAVGTMAFLGIASGTLNNSPGDVRSGTTLFWASNNFFTAAPLGFGQWKLIGATNSPSSSLWLRIS